MADKQMTSLTSLTAATPSSSANTGSNYGGRTRSINRLSVAESAKHAGENKKALGSGQRTASTSRIQSSSRSKMPSRPSVSADPPGNLHSSATSLNRMSRNDDDVEDHLYKMADLSAAKKTRRNRWSVHGQAMNNSTSAPTSTSIPAPASKQNGGKFKVVNKLNTSSARVAVRPTQAIKPLNQYVEEKANVTSSPSFNQTFDLETTEFKSITAHKLLKGISVNSIDTIVEVNMLATEIDKGKPTADDAIEDEKIKSKMADLQLQQQQIAQA